MELAILNYVEHQRAVGMFTQIVQIEMKLTAMLESVDQFKYFGNMNHFNRPVLIEDSRSDRSWYGQITHISYTQMENYVQLRLIMICEDPKQKEYKRLDEKYPHGCHKCGKILFFKELLKANKELTGEALATLWKREEVEFYCCSCYRGRERFQTESEQISSFFHEYEQNPHPNPLNHIAISTPRQSYFWANVRDRLRPGDLLQRADDGGLEPIGFVNGFTYGERNDGVYALAHSYELHGQMRVNHELGILERRPRQADKIIHDKIKNKKIRRFITKCVKKVIFWTKFWIF